MTDVLLTIKQMCEKYDVTARTLRFYEDKELISPIRDGQKRLYRKADRARLKVILRAKYFDFSLDEARILLDGRDPHHPNAMRPEQMVAMMQQQLTKLQNNQAELTQKIAALEKELDFSKQSFATDMTKTQAA